MIRFNNMAAESITRRAFIAANTLQRKNSKLFVADREELLQLHKGKEGWFIFEFSLTFPQALLGEFEGYGLYMEQIEDIYGPPLLLQAIDCTKPNEPIPMANVKMSLRK